MKFNAARIFDSSDEMQRLLQRISERIARLLEREGYLDRDSEEGSLLPDGRLSYELKTPYKNGTTHVIFEPLDFIARIAALVPKPRFHLTRFHGVFAPNSKHRTTVTSDAKEKQAQRSAGASSLSDA